MLIDDFCINIHNLTHRDVLGDIAYPIFFESGEYEAHLFIVLRFPLNDF